MIDKFEEENWFLSNFYPSPIVYEGIAYPTVEHAYQAAKTLDMRARQKISLLRSPNAAKKMGRIVDIRADWEEIKLAVMYDCLRLKFADPILKQKLLDTGSVQLVEGNWWGDVFWGVCKGKGQNHLGKLLMRIRSE